MYTTYLKQQALQRMDELSAENIPFLFIIDYRMRKNIILPFDEVDTDDVLFLIKGFGNVPGGPVPGKPFEFTASPVTFEEYHPKFNLVQKALHAGDSYLTNLTAETAVAMNYSLEEVFYKSRAPYKLLLQNHCTVFSPETFVAIEEGIISTCPMKGTIDAAIPGAEQIILNDEKETAEQNTIVDLLRNDLNIISDDVRVERFRYVEEIESRGKRLLQVSSKIAGNLRPGYQKKIGTLLMAMLPAGSVTGAPKKRTVEIIEEAEGYERGYYTGVFGYYANGKLDSGVMIRFIEKKENGYVFKSGGGITYLSDARKEYQEMIDKVYVPFT